MTYRSESRLERRSHIPARRLRLEGNHIPRRAERASRPLTPHPSLLTGARQRAFTLIEILAAFVVFALAFGAVMQALSGSIQNTVQSRGYTQAALMARSKMESLGVTEPIQPGGERGELDDGYRYDLEIREWEPPEGAAPDGNLQPQVVVYHVTLKVQWGEAPRVRQAEFTTLRAVSREL